MNCPCPPYLINRNLIVGREKKDNAQEELCIFDFDESV
jgi:hypothetical protein